MNILMLTPDYPPVYGGIGTHVNFLVQKLLERNKVTVLVRRITINKNGGYIKTTVNKKLTVIDIPNSDFILSGHEKYSIDNYYNIEMNTADILGRSIRELLEILPEEKYDIIHMHDAYTCMAGKLLSIYMKIPLITTLHSMHADKTSIKYYLREYAVNNSNYVIAVSRFIKNKALQKFHCRSDKIAVVYNSINMEHVFLQKEIDSDKREISFCGRFEEIKGVITIIYAFKRILETVSKANVKLNLIGDGSLREKVFDLIKELDLEDNVNVYSNIAHQEVLKIFCRSCCVVIPSIEEPFATVGLEAMSVKTAVICTNVGGMSEMVLHEKTGYVYSPKDTKALEQYMMKLIKDSAKARKFGVEGYNRVRQLFTWEHNALKIEEIYRNVIKNIAPPEEISGDFDGNGETYESHRS